MLGCNRFYPYNTLLSVILDSHDFGAPMGTSAPTGIKILLTILYYIGINNVFKLLPCNVAFKSFDLTLLMAQTAIFPKRVCDQMIYDYWHHCYMIEILLKGSTNNLAQMAQKGSPYAFEAEITPLKF